MKGAESVEAETAEGDRDQAIDVRILRHILDGSDIETTQVRLAEELGSEFVSDNSGLLRHIYEDLSGSSLIAPLRSDQSRILECQLTDGGISTVGVVTRDRPQLLQRSLESYSRNVRDAGHRPNLVVCDDSTGKSSDANAGIAAEIGRKFGLQVFYLGWREKVQLAEHVARACRGSCRVRCRERSSIRCTPAIAGAQIPMR